MLVLFNQQLLYAADRWIYFDEQNGIRYFFDNDGVFCTPEGNLNVWIQKVNDNYRIFYTEYQLGLLGVKKDSDLHRKMEEPVTRIDLNHYEFDCERRIYRILKAQWHYQSDNYFRDNKGANLYTWTSAPPNSIIEHQLLTLCKNFYRAKCYRQGVSSSKDTIEDNTNMTTGTGVIISGDGLIVTAAHLVINREQISVMTKDGIRKSQILKIDRINDIVLLKCAGTFKPVPLISPTNVKLGQPVFTIGFPNIDVQGFNPKLTKGEINSLSGYQDDIRHWQISIPVQPGNSGGPLFDEFGNVIGLILSKLDSNLMLKKTGDLPQNVNYAIKNTYVLP
jgi:hypothetical protein